MVRPEKIKKIAAVFFSAVYLQVNVAWSGMPTLPIPQTTAHLLHSTLQTLLPKKIFRAIFPPDHKDKVFVFHQGPGVHGGFLPDHEAATRLEEMRRLQEQETHSARPFVEPGRPRNQQGVPQASNPGAASQGDEHDQSPAAQPQRTETVTAVSEMDGRDVLRTIGATGQLPDPAGGFAVNCTQGATLTEDSNGVHLDGTITWETGNGLSFEATGTDSGDIMITMTVDENVQGEVEFIEVDHQTGRIIAKTIYHAGDQEVRVNNQLTSFVAGQEAIIREVQVPQAQRRGMAGPGQREPPALVGGVGEYVVREGRIDSTFRMERVQGEDRVQLTSMVNNQTGSFQPIYQPPLLTILFPSASSLKFPKSSISN